VPDPWDGPLGPATSPPPPASPLSLLLSEPDNEDDLKDDEHDEDEEEDVGLPPACCDDASSFRGTGDSGAPSLRKQNSRCLILDTHTHDWAWEPLGLPSECQNP